MGKRKAQRTIAVVGCAHGCLDEIYATILYINEHHQKNIELLIICGDMQTLRNEQDMDCLACPAKYRQMGIFHEYYTGVKTAPVLTLFIGGNHEASNYLQELRYGGYVAPNVFYLGTAGVINVHGLRIGGISGIYKHFSFHKPHFETYPYNDASLRSVYHTRQLETYQLSCVSTSSLDVMISHDWPRGIEQYGNTHELLRKKPFFREEVQANTLGNPATEYLVHKLQPRYWFSGHLHVKFPATVAHADVPHDSAGPPKETKFLALDKCVPGKEFLQVLDIEVEEDDEETSAGAGSSKIELDLEWLSILRATHHLSSPTTQPSDFPPEALPRNEQDLLWLQQKVHLVPNPFQFHKTVRGYNEPGFLAIERRGNPQTDQLLDLLQLPHQLTVPCAGQVLDPPASSQSIPIPPVPPVYEDPNAIDLEEDEEDIVLAATST